MLIGQDEIISSPDAGVRMSKEEFEKAVETIMDEADMEFETEMDGDLIKPNVGSLCHGMRGKVKRKYSQVGVLSSMKMNGMGKSSLLYWMGREVDKKFEIPRNFFFRGNQELLTQMTDNLPSGSILLMDEMVRLWYKRRAMTKNVVDLNEWMGADQRKTEVILMGAIPDFWDMDAYAREGKVDYYIECLSRGVGIMFVADHFPGVNPWHPDEMKKIHQRRTAFGAENVVEKIELLEKHPCYKKVVFWSRMPKDDEKLYLDCLRKSADDNSTEDMATQIERVRTEMNLKYENDQQKAMHAVVRLVQMLKLRTVTMQHIFREANIDASTFKRYEKEVSKAIQNGKFDKPVEATTVEGMVEQGNV